MLGMFSALWRYRGFVFSSIKNEFVGRFARSRLGGLWMIIHPLAQVAIYALILSAVLASKLPGIDNQYGYAIYLTSGILAWTLFSEVITRCLTLFIEQGNLMKKMAFPRVSLPTIVAGSCLLNHFFLFVAIFGIFTLLWHPLGLALLYLPLLTLLTLTLALGLGLVLGVLNVFLCDIGQAVLVLSRLIRERGKPRSIWVDNGTEFTPKVMDQWAYWNKVQLDFSRSGKPTHNAVIESFNGRLRQECLNQNWFLSLQDVREKLESWRMDYNQMRPHSSLGNRTPEDFQKCGSG